MYKLLLRRSSTHFTLLLFGKILSSVVFIYLARLLQPASFGEVVLYLTYINLGTLLADFGLIQWYQKHSHLLSKKKHIHAVLSGRFITLLVTIPVLSLLLFLTASFSFQISMLLIFTLLPEALLSIFDGYYFSEKKPLKVSGKLLIRNVLFVMGLFLISKNVSHLNLYVLYLVSSLLTLIWYLPYQYLVDWKFSLSQGIETLRQSSRYALLIFTSFAYARGDSLIIQYSLGPSFLGLYSAAYRYLDALSLAPTALAQNLFHISANKNAVSKNNLMKITLAMLVAGVAISSIMYLNANILTTVMLGSEYQAAQPLVQIFSFVLVLFFINSPLSTVVQSSDIFKSFLPWGIINTVGNIALNILFVPVFGIVASAWIMLLSEISGLIINLWFVRKTYHET